MIYIITGQTATGKTSLALEYAFKYNGELINCDSRQVYKHLDIITGKDLPSNSKFKIYNLKFEKFDIGYYTLKTKLWLYDIVDPKQYFSSYDYARCALSVIKDILKRKKTPIIVGGSGFYLKHLLYGFPSVDIPPNWELRKRLERKTLPELQIDFKNLVFNLSQRSSLQESKLLTLNNSDLNNPRRLIRKIEILSSPEISNHPNLPNIPNTPNHPNLPAIFIGLKYKNKQDLINAIKIRVEKRLQQEAVKEVKNLLKQGYKESDPGLKTIGYQQIIQFIKGKLTKEEAIGQWITKEVQYAKRQYTYLKKYFNIGWQEI